MMCSAVNAVVVTLLVRPLHSFSPKLQGQVLSQTHKQQRILSVFGKSPTSLFSASTSTSKSKPGSNDKGKRKKSKKSSSNSPSPIKTPINTNTRFHPRNAFTGSYDMEHLCKFHPPLQSFLRVGHTSKALRSTIDFGDPHAVRALNAALLAADYGISEWSSFLPSSCLCPPIPGRADYIHHVADILAASKTGADATGSNDTHIPTGPSIRGLDIGTGATLIYPLLGTQTYGWSFIATDVDANSITSARKILSANTLDSGNSKIDIRLQRNKQHALKHVLGTDRIDFVMCNPPFYESAAAYQKESQRKVRNLAANAKKRQKYSGGGHSNNNNNNNNREHQNSETTKESGTSNMSGSNNFRGGPSELWFPGGEVAFITKLIQESSDNNVVHMQQCLWFSSLVSRRDNLPTLLKILEQAPAEVKDTRIIPMGQGGLKTSHILFWSFHDREEQREWYRRQ